MTPLTTQPPSSRAHLLRMCREIQGRDYIRFSSSKFELVRVVSPLPPFKQRLRPYGEKLARAMAEAGVDHLPGDRP